MPLIEYSENRLKITELMDAELVENKKVLYLLVSGTGRGLVDKEKTIPSLMMDLAFRKRCMLGFIVSPDSMGSSLSRNLLYQTLLSDYPELEKVWIVIDN
ncbi:MAG TPA: hypothetical protein VNC84_07755 [Gammaproteobacteria bacterium]|jgi:hypothetical protein|nr:hypothetical protein [Gammaproteobacteria bacterium]